MSVDFLSAFIVGSVATAPTNQIASSIVLNFFFTFTCWHSMRACQSYLTIISCITLSVYIYFWWPNILIEASLEVIVNKSSAQYFVCLQVKSESHVVIGAALTVRWAPGKVWPNESVYIIENESKWNKLKESESAMHEEETSVRS